MSKSDGYAAVACSRESTLLPPRLMVSSRQRAHACLQHETMRSAPGRTQ
jgi:hypothetical protein